MKYSNYEVAFAEVPDEISLAISISGCPNRCKGCHSPHLNKDEGHNLDWGSLNTLIHINTGITCVAFLGGDGSPADIDKLAYHVKRLGLKTCWYSGNDELSSEINLENFDYIKLGHYDDELGPLNKETTNQRFYKVENRDLIDITNKFWGRAI